MIGLFLLTYLAVMFVIPILMVVFLLLETANLISNLTERKKNEASDMG